MESTDRHTRWALWVDAVEGQRPRLWSDPDAVPSTGWVPMENVGNGERVKLQAIVGEGIHAVWDQPGRTDLRLTVWAAEPPDRRLTLLFDLRFLAGKAVTPSQEQELEAAPKAIKEHVSRFVETGEGL